MLAPTPKARWTAADIPSQQGRTAVVTGTGGLGYEIALALARAGAGVIIAGRNPEKGEAAALRIAKTVPGALATFEALDLARLESIADFASRMATGFGSIDLLVNNAGVMTPPRRQETADGFELQLGTNYLGHFALTARLLPLLREGAGARVVTVSSIAAQGGTMDLDDLGATWSYRPMPVYARSKLACLMFARELQRRSEAGGWGLASMAAHPGIARTELLHNAPGRWSMSGIARSALWFLFQPVDQGALPMLYAGTAPQAVPGVYYGSDRMRETRGHPAPAKVPPATDDPATNARLWEISEAMTGAGFP
ncbi:SDR family oxidoreductase [Acuticoccus sediminis]|uniref:SDR family oxidoreductase n=1 Tax=Acuticoccus sediminis TaxID=2184697 RepID=UPI001CFEC58B|nr:SDR family oxidoreductase [Acuticoccus sediminis]